MCYRLLDIILDKGKVSNVWSAPVFAESDLFVRLGPIENLKKLDSAPARVTCGILTFLAISAWTQAFNAELPKVSYIKAIDVWTVTCNLFVFLSLMEYAFAQGLVRIFKVVKGTILARLWKKCLWFLQAEHRC